MFDKERSLIFSEDQKPDHWTFDGIFNIIQKPFVNFFFPWVVIILVIHRNNWKKPIIYILLFHYIFRAIGDILRTLSNEIPVHIEQTTWPYTKTRYYIGCVLALAFWLIGEIIGDWYPSVRTCKIVHSKKKKILVQLSCVIYNISKLLTLGVYIYYGKKLKLTAQSHTEDDMYFAKLLQTWWIVSISNFVFGVINDACVIYALQTEVFNKVKTIKGNTRGFVEMFKQVSEFRIIVSMVISICYIIVIIPIIFYKCKESASPKKKVANVFDQFDINSIREAVIYFNHTMMYIDQILLKFISTFPNTNKKKHITTTNETVSDYSSITPY